MTDRKRIILPLLAVILTFAALWWTNRAVTPKQSTWADVEAEARAGGYQLITTQKLREKYEKDPNSLLLIDTRQEWEFATGHIERAINFPMAPTWWDRWRQAEPLRAMLGPDLNREIVFY